MKSPIEILHEIDRIKNLLRFKTFQTVTAREEAELLQARIEALEWVLSEKA